MHRYDWAGWVEEPCLLALYLGSLTAAVVSLAGWRSAALAQVEHYEGDHETRDRYRTFLWSTRCPRPKINSCYSIFLCILYASSSRYLSPPVLPTFLLLPAVQMYFLYTARDGPPPQVVSSSACITHPAGLDLSRRMFHLASPLHPRSESWYGSTKSLPLMNWHGG